MLGIKQRRYSEDPIARRSLLHDSSTPGISIPTIVRTSDDARSLPGEDGSLGECSDLVGIVLGDTESDMASCSGEHTNSVCGWLRDPPLAALNFPGLRTLPPSPPPVDGESPLPTTGACAGLILSLGVLSDMANSVCRGKTLLWCRPFRPV